eukprot:Rmarinus@m.29485
MTVTSPLPYYIVFAIPLSVLLGFYFAGHFFTFFLVFGFLPLLDGVFGVDEVNPTKEEEAELKDDFKYRIITFLWFPAQLGMLLWGASVLDQLDGPVAFFGHCLSVGMIGSLGINAAHELGHKMNKLEQAVAKCLLNLVGYGHFYIEHVHGHHKNVATPNDPASATLGQSFYSFYPQTLVGGFTSAWRIEAARLAREGKPVVSLHNQMIWFVAIPLALCASFYAHWGAKGALYFAMQGWIALSLLEIINYVEHYGLRRKEIRPGVYENVGVVHSWNAPQRVTNWFLFKLQRHSDHHAHALRRYQILRNFAESPELPSGYPGMALLALFPPLWRRVMDPRVISYNSSSHAKTN